jgi:hypothetical protein
MGRIKHDFNFIQAWKPCNLKRGEYSNNTCIDNAENDCPYFFMCDLPIKTPSVPPTINWRKIKKLIF